MSLARLATRPVTYLRWSEDGGGTDPYGSPIPGWTPDGSTTNVWLEQTSATEVTVDGDIQTSDWLLVDPNPSAGLTGRDKVDIDGTEYRIVGPPDVVHTPRGPHHVEARLATVDPQ